MRTKEEIERAVAHYKRAIATPWDEANMLVLAQLLSNLDMLQWVLGNPSDFEQTMEAMDKQRLFDVEIGTGQVN